mmetsp:Transcript_18091/g.68598  ORF Transcript_18091/g.68598 Transcript_18091/m.68598 type:complete len:209 (-) Transcript_18091:549-1175(-)
MTFVPGPPGADSRLMTSLARSCLSSGAGASPLLSPSLLRDVFLVNKRNGPMPTSTHLMATAAAGDALSPSFSAAAGLALPLGFTSAAFVPTFSPSGAILAPSLSSFDALATADDFTNVTLSLSSLSACTATKRNSFALNSNWHSSSSSPFSGLTSGSSTTGALSSSSFFVSSEPSDCNEDVDDAPNTGFGVGKASSGFASADAPAQAT